MDLLLATFGGVLGLYATCGWFIRALMRADRDSLVWFFQARWLRVIGDL